MCSGTLYETDAGALCSHCGTMLKNYGCIDYPYWCPSCKYVAMDEFEGLSLDAEDWADTDWQAMQHLWRQGCDCEQCVKRRANARNN